MAEAAGRFYEVMFIIRPDVAEEDVDKLVSNFENTITTGGGSIRSIEKMGRRKLAYTVRKFNDGNYVLLTIDADGKLVAELERRLRVTEPVIKYLTVRMDEEEKRLDKVRALRASKTKRSAQPSANAVSVTDAPAAQPAVSPAASAAPVGTETPALA